MLRVLLSSVALLLFTNVEAQQYPSRPIRFVMAYPPGGSSDALARPIANEMTKGLGQPVLLEYKPGGLDLDRDGVERADVAEVEVAGRRYAQTFARTPQRFEHGHARGAESDLGK